MENENISVANNVPQTSTSDNPAENVVNPMKAVSAPLMPTMLKFAQQQQQSDGSNENSPQEYRIMLKAVKGCNYDL